MRSAVGLGALVLVLSAAAPTSAGPTAAGPAAGVDVPTLTGLAVLPAHTFVPASEPSGAQLGTAPINGVTPPFEDQPVQGFSGIVRRADGTFEVISDNGYGRKSNSADFALRVNRIVPDLATGAIDVLGGFNLTDPAGHLPFPLTRPDRVLTGADLDVESVVRLPDGSYWMGDEFGPFLVHVDRAGRVLSPPVQPSGVTSPEHPAGGTATIGRSKGFEAMVASPDRRFLYPLLEGTVAGDPAGTLRLYEFDLRTGAFTDRRWAYRLAAPNLAIGDAAAIDAHRFLVVERDSAQGDAAQVKQIYLVDRRDRDGDGAVDKTPLVDLLNVANPRGLGGFPETFRFPFDTIENVTLLDARTIAVVQDNNFPFSNGRTPGVPDATEFITIRLPESLRPDPRVLRAG
jgi:hypothetical protein